MKILCLSFSFHDMKTECFSNASVLNSLYQKHLSRGVLRQMFSENMHAANFIYRRTPIPKCNLLNSHFDMDVLLWICCISSEHLFQRTLLDGHFFCIPKLPNKSCILCKSKLNLIYNHWLFAKYLLFVFCLLHFKASLHYFHQYVVFSYWKYLTAMQWFLVVHM